MWNPQSAIRNRRCPQTHGTLQELPHLMIPTVKAGLIARFFAFLRKIAVTVFPSTSCTKMAALSMKVNKGQSRLIKVNEGIFRTGMNGAPSIQYETRQVRVAYFAGVGIGRGCGTSFGNPSLRRSPQEGGDCEESGPAQDRAVGEIGPRLAHEGVEPRLRTSPPRPSPPQVCGGEGEEKGNRLHEPAVRSACRGKIGLDNFSGAGQYRANAKRKVIEL